MLFKETLTIGSQQSPETQVIITHETTFEVVLEHLMLQLLGHNIISYILQGIYLPFGRQQRIHMNGISSCYSCLY